MKNILIFAICLMVFPSFAQHPLANKGPKAKNYNPAKDNSLKSTKILLFDTPSDKYQAGANAKNGFAVENASKSVSNVNTVIVRGKGANAKNKYFIVELPVKKEGEVVDPKETEIKGKTLQ